MVAAQFIQSVYSLNSVAIGLFTNQPEYILILKDLINKYM